MSCSFWNQRRRLAALKKAAEKKVEPIKVEPIKVEPIEEKKPQKPAKKK